MIIDLIFERKDGEPYCPRMFYTNVLDYGEIGFGITRALDNGTEQDVKRELIKYVANNNYPLNVVEYILSVNWLEMEN